MFEELFMFIGTLFTKVGTKNKKQKDDIVFYL